MEALSQLPEMESIEVLKSALDQMRHFLWFYMQVMTEDSDTAQTLREGIGSSPQRNSGSRESAAAESLRLATDAAMLQYLTDAKNRKPN
jgi:homoserine acetyltransferase